MIKATELRIGNWVIIKDDVRGNYTYEITAHDLEEMESFEDDYKSNGVLPIPLTPEILEKAGFEARNERMFRKEINHVMIKRVWVYNSNDHYPNDDNWYLGAENKHEEQISGIIINHLHQLQNLYFALTGEELEINL